MSAAVLGCEQATSATLRTRFWDARRAIQAGSCAPVALFYRDSGFFPVRLAQTRITPIILRVGFLMCDESGKNEKQEEKRDVKIAQGAWGLEREAVLEWSIECSRQRSINDSQDVAFDLVGRSFDGDYGIVHSGGPALFAPSEIVGCSATVFETYTLFC